MCQAAAAYHTYMGNTSDNTPRYGDTARRDATQPLSSPEWNQNKMKFSWHTLTHVWCKFPYTFFYYLSFFFQIWCQRLLDWPIAVLSLISKPVGVEGRQAGSSRQADSTRRCAALITSHSRVSRDL